ncbi:TetR/AcrR family transcriptional regulator [Spirillospora sp. NPDC047279]|uniref:TetR/AcrR family transcriptional regulator n=1 Tax=Spirillospora sp. NPDC047279 TaxID=3155478 RepID=UPI0033C63CE4
MADTNEPGRRAGYHHGALPDALTAAALALLDEGGLDRVTVRETARRAGVSPGAPFRHFADREALLTAVAADVLADFRRWQEAALAEVADRPAMWVFGRSFIRYATVHPHRFELLRRSVYGPRRVPELRPYVDEVERLVGEVVAGGQRSGELRPGDPAVVALAGHALVYGLCQMIVDGFLPEDQVESLVDQVLDTIGIGLARPPGEDPPGIDGNAGGVCNR